MSRIKGMNYQTINGQIYFTKRALMPDGSWKIVYGKNEVDWAKKSKKKYDHFNDAVKEGIPLDTILLKNEISEWLDHIKATCSQKTLEEYTWSVNKHLLPHIGKTKLVDVTTPFAIAVVNKVKKQSSVYMAQRINKRLNQIMNWHVERERGLEVNPISKVVQKDLAKAIAKAEKYDKNPVISTTNVSRFLDYFKDSDLLPVWGFMSLSGLRIAESLAVSFSDINFEANSIYVHQQITDKGELVKTKTRASTRSVPLPTALKALLLEIPEEKRTGLITLNSHGTPIRPNNLRYQHFHPAIKHLREQYPDFDLKNPHQFRKFFISFHIDNSTNLEVVSRWVGHSDSNITQRVYAQPINETKNHNADLMSGLLEDETPNTPTLVTIDQYLSGLKTAAIK